MDGNITCNKSCEVNETYSNEFSKDDIITKINKTTGFNQNGNFEIETLSNDSTLPDMKFDNLKLSDLKEHKSFELSSSFQKQQVDRNKPKTSKEILQVNLICFKARKTLRRVFF